jgi:hypothetical protein
LVVALGTFLIYEYVQGIVTDTAIDASSQVVKESPIDERSKASMLSTLTLAKILGAIAVIVGIVAIIKKYT